MVEEAYSHIVLAYYKKIFSTKDNQLCNLSATDISILEIIYHMKRTNYSQLSDYMKMSMPNLTYRIKNLINKGYISSEIDQDDKRIHYLSVTNKFIDLYCMSEAVIEKYVNEMANLLTDDEYKNALVIIEKIMYYYAHEDNNDE